MRTWPVKDSEVRFSELLDACLSEGPQMVTRHGIEVAVLLPLLQWRRLQSAARPLLKELLLSDQARPDMLIPPRGRAKKMAQKPADFNEQPALARNARLS
jgi:antitoxin Phd